MSELMMSTFSTLAQIYLPLVEPHVLNLSAERVVQVDPGNRNFIHLKRLFHNLPQGEDLVPQISDILVHYLHSNILFFLNKYLLYLYF